MDFAIAEVVQIQVISKHNAKDPLTLILLMSILIPSEHLKILTNLPLFQYFYKFYLLPKHLEKQQNPWESHYSCGSRNKGVLIET